MHLMKVQRWEYTNMIFYTEELIYLELMIKCKYSYFVLFQLTSCSVIFKS